MRRQVIAPKKQRRNKVERKTKEKQWYNTNSIDNNNNSNANISSSKCEHNNKQ